MAIINLGSLAIDHVYRVDHIAGAGETLAAQDYQVFPGGKGLNQSLAAARAGAVVRHAGLIGSDGELLRRTLADGGVDVSLLAERNGASGHALIQVDASGANSIVISGGTNRQFTHTDIDHVLEQIDRDDWLLLQNEINDLDYVLG